MKTTPLYSCHLELHAQMTEFAGYQMPVRYTSDKQEHMAVREQAGLFDVSHMGEIWVTGPLAQKSLNRLLTQDVEQKKIGQAFYGLLLNSNNGIVDDVITYKFNPEKFLICINAANRKKDFQWIQAHCDAEVRDASDDWCQIAIQGPEAIDITANILGEEIRDIRRFHFKLIQDLIIARTGYTGEDGFEIFVPPTKASQLWQRLVQQARPCGLAARDTLRLEAGMCLYGQDINEETSPEEAGLTWCIQRSTPLKIPKRHLKGLIMKGTAIARPEYEVVNAQEQNIGYITSGTKTPFVNQAIAMAYLDSPYCEASEEVYVKVRGRLEAAIVTQLPFYRRTK